MKRIDLEVLIEPQKKVFLTTRTSVFNHQHFEMKIEVLCQRALL